MAPIHYHQLLSANAELRKVLKSIDALVRGNGNIATIDLPALGQLLESMAPLIAGSSRAISPDVALQAQIQEYIAHLHALQGALEKVRCVMLARRAQLDAARQHIDSVQSWADAYRQTS